MMAFLSSICYTFLNNVAAVFLHRQLHIVTLQLVKNIRCHLWYVKQHILNNIISAESALRAVSLISEIYNRYQQHRVIHYDLLRFT